jgi:hypothetical protein
MQAESKSVDRQNPEGRWSCSLAVLLFFALIAVNRGDEPTAKDRPKPTAPVAYTTRFMVAENPLSEGGRWENGKTLGLDWGDVSTTAGTAIGHAGPARYADATALLKGTWGPDQLAEATVYAGKTIGYPEVELRLRSSLSPHICTGYEISNSVGSEPSAYLIIVRWNGRLADFTYLANLHGKEYGVKTGDVVKATIVGHVITAFKNDVQLAQVTDKTYATGNLGLGFNEGTNGDYGLTFAAGH